MIDRCVCCGEYVPEGRQVCERCELIGPKELLIILKREAARREVDGGRVSRIYTETTRREGV